MADEWFTLIPAGDAVTVGTILITNRSGVAMTYQLAIVDGSDSTIQDEDYIAYDVAIATDEKGLIEYNNLLRLSAGFRLMAQASTTSSSFQVWGSL